MSKIVMYGLVVITTAVLLLHYSSSSNCMVSQIASYLLVVLVIFQVFSKAIAVWRKPLYSNSETSAKDSQKPKTYKAAAIWLCLVAVFYVLQQYLKGHGVSLDHLSDWLFLAAIGAGGVVVLVRRIQSKERS